MAIRGSKLVIVGIIGALLGAGCLSIENEIQVFPDGSGRLSSTLEFDSRAYANFLQRSIEEEFPQQRELVGEDFQQPDLGISEKTVCLGSIAATEFLPSRIASKDSDQELAGLSIEASSNNGKCSVTESLEWTAEEFPEVGRLLAEEGTRVMKLDSGNWRLEVDDLVQDPSLGLTSELGFAAELQELSEMWEGMAGLVFDVTVSVSVTLPGEPVDHNAHVVEGSRFSWSFDLMEIMEGSEVKLYAETNPEGDGGLGAGAVVAIILLGILGLAIVLAIGLRHQRARSPQGAEVAATGGDAEVASCEGAEVAVTGGDVEVESGESGDAEEGSRVLRDDHRTVEDDM